MYVCQVNVMLSYHNIDILPTSRNHCIFLVISVAEQLRQILRMSLNVLYAFYHHWLPSIKCGEALKVCSVGF